MRLDGLNSEMQAMMAEAANARPAATGQKVGADFSQMLTQAINTVNGLQQSSSNLQTRFDRGDEGISLSDVMIVRNKSSVAFEATIQVRNKLVDAYKELMNMPV
ncbi:flagellar hook-basal body complex protein FliE [Vibrio metschnikovii]|nr:flagellar hook-basal body complex protein FliE [Vibrio metschnikovii]EKO3653788.1 flagellar hook-basal body complex protein FliE [Vibrio metschnikovii]